MRLVSHATNFNYAPRIVILGGLLLGFGMLTGACSSIMKTNSSVQFAGGSTTTVSASQVADQVRQLQSPENRVVYEQARATALADVYSNTLNIAPTGPVELGGHTFDNTHDILMAHADDLQSISDDYGTVGNFMDAVGITSMESVTEEEIQAYFDLLDKVINQGIANQELVDAAQSDAEVATIATDSGAATTEQNAVPTIQTTISNTAEPASTTSTNSVALMLCHGPSKGGGQRRTPCMSSSYGALGAGVGGISSYTPPAATTAGTHPAATTGAVGATGVAGAAGVPSAANSMGYMAAGANAMNNCSSFASGGLSGPPTSLGSSFAHP